LLVLVYDTYSIKTRWRATKKRTICINPNPYEIHTQYIFRHHNLKRLNRIPYVDFRSISFLTILLYYGNILVIHEVYIYIYINCYWTISFGTLWKPFRFVVGISVYVRIREYCRIAKPWIYIIYDCSISP